MDDLHALQHTRNARTRDVLQQADNTIPVEGLDSPPLPTDRPPTHHVVTIQCAVRIMQAKQTLQTKMLAQFHQEEQERTRKSNMQVAEGLALVDQAKLIQQMKDQLVLDRKKAVKTNNLEKAIQLHSNNKATTSIEDEFGLESADEESSSSGSGSSSSEEQGGEVKKERQQEEGTSLGQKRGGPTTVVQNGREYAVKEDDPSEQGEEDDTVGSDSGRDSGRGDDESSGEGDGEEEEELSRLTARYNGEKDVGKRAQEKRLGRLATKESEATTWCRRVQEFQCDREELLQLRRVDLESRVRDLEVLLSQLSGTIMEALTSQGELTSQTEILDITIGQLMERISPGNLDVKTGSHKKGRSFPKPNTTRKFFDRL